MIVRLPWALQFEFKAEIAIIVRLSCKNPSVDTNFLYLCFIFRLDDLVVLFKLICSEFHYPTKKQKTQMPLNEPLKRFNTTTHMTSCGLLFYIPYLGRGTGTPLSPQSQPTPAQHTAQNSNRLAPVSNLDEVMSNTGTSSSQPSSLNFSFRGLSKIALIIPPQEVHSVVTFVPSGPSLEYKLFTVKQMDQVLSKQQNKIFIKSIAYYQYLLIFHTAPNSYNVYPTAAWILCRYFDTRTCFLELGLIWFTRQRVTQLLINMLTTQSGV